MILTFLKNYRRILPAVLAVCFALGFVAGAWIGPGTIGKADRRAAVDEVPSAQTVSSAGIAPAQESSPETMIVPAEGRTVGVYGWYRDSVMDDWRFRDGLDISCVSGTRVSAALPGSVTEISRAQDGGYSVSLKHAGEVKTTYANLNAVWVEVGQQVAAGKPLGEIGVSSSGGVLRFTVECDGESKDPAVCLGQRF